MKLFCSIILAFSIIGITTASNLRQRTMYIAADTTQLDTLSIAPQSLLLYMGGDLVADSLFRIDYIKGQLIAPELTGTEIEVRYRVFGNNFNQPYRRRSPSLAKSDTVSTHTMPGGTGPQPTTGDSPSGVNTSGSIARGLSIGNSQDIVLNSSMNLQIDGYITDNIQISAAISDQNIPIQPEGNTQQISEFDKVYIKLYDGANAVIFGDFESENGQGEFLRYTKKGLGARGETEVSIKDTRTLSGNASFALSKGKYCQIDIAGREGSQGPYRIYGCGGEAFIVILSESERVYLDGKIVHRGEDLDYTIDYNAGELSFTSRQLITKDTRIVIEFEYSEQNYARFFVTENFSYKADRHTSWINIYSEQDNRNQPFQQDTLGRINDALHRSGDKPVFVDNVIEDTVWNAQKIYYARRDTALADGRRFDSVYVYSIEKDVARYVIGFSYVGSGKGHYRRISSAANGKVYEWVAPSPSGIPSGDYLPVRIVAAPEKTQVLAAGTRIRLGAGTELTTEAAVSNRDKNTASPYGNEDNIGGAASLGVEHKWKMSVKKNIIFYGKYQLVNEDFEAVGAFRPVEFGRDWSLSQGSKTDEHLVSGGIKYIGESAKADVTHSSFLRTDQYEGHKQSGTFATERKGLRSSANGSVLRADAKEYSSLFYRAEAEVSHRVWVARLGLLGGYEWLDKRDTLSNLLQDAQGYYRIGSYMEEADSTGPQFRLSVVQRYDQRPDLLMYELKDVTSSTDYSADLGLYSHDDHTFAIGGTYRILRASDTAWARANSITPENNLGARMEHSIALWKASIRNRIYIETGSGLELKRDYSFVEVTPGQGSYQWVDYNGNGVPELNEFELAQYQQQADYMRVFLSTNEYVRVYDHTFNHNFSVDPYIQWRSAEGWRRYAGRFAVRTSYSFARKIDRTDFWSNLLPGPLFVGGAEVQSLQSSFRGTLSANKPNHRVSGSYTYQSSQNTILSSNGSETRTSEENGGELRWNITDALSAYKRCAAGRQIAEMEATFLDNREYRIWYYMLAPRAELQPGPNTVFESEYLFRKKQNASALSEHSTENNISLQVRYSHPRRGRIASKLSTVYMQYNGTSGTALAYTMLESLQPGKNFLWELQYARSLSEYLQLSMTYNGQKSEGSRSMHFGSVQLRAVF